MQSGYGVPETQQFIMDGCTSSLLSISHDISNSSQAQKQHLQYHQDHHQQLQQEQQQQQRYLHIQHHIPITQPFFQQHHHLFQTFQHHQQRQLHQQLGLDNESGPENSNSPSQIVAGSGPPFIVANFKLGVNENSGSRREAAWNDDDEVLRGRREDGSDRWQHREEESAIKEPFWKPLDVEYMNRNHKRCKEKMENPYEFCEKGEKGMEIEEGKSSGSNYGLFGELEAIYTIGGVGNVGNNQTGSGSALTGDNPPATAVVLGSSGDPCGGIDHASETSTGEEVSLKMLQKKRRKKRRKQLGVIAVFFESLVKQLMEHQESLHRKFLEVIEKRDQERMNREEAWRIQEAAKSNLEAMTSAQEHALASSREDAIVAFLEKITGESNNLPTKTQIQFPSQFHEESHRDERPMEATVAFNRNDITSNNDNTTSNNVDNSMNINIQRRWPKAEVQALIRLRSSLESKFQEPGLKGPLWEQMSSSMASMGYQRSAKRCKEKWENINKYFRKTKNSAKKRSQQYSKTCPYFHQLDQFYSKSPIASRKPSGGHAVIVGPKNYSELLDDIVVVPSRSNSQNPSTEFSQEQFNIRRDYNFSSLGLDFNGNGSDNRHEEGGHNEDEEQEEEDDDDEVEGEEKDAENLEHVQNQDIEGEHGDEEHSQKPALFALES